MRLYFYGFIAVFRRFVLRQNVGVVVCDFAEQMGVVYIKVAQILAMQNLGEYFTESDRERLASICDQCNPIKFQEIDKILEMEYGCPTSEIFQHIDPKPLGSASISQVHRAVLKDGRVVAVKVKRRDVTRKVERDIRQIKRLVHRFGKVAKLKNFIGSDRALEYYTNWIYEETDFKKEQIHLVRYREFAESVNGKVEGVGKILTPKVYREFCTDNIIVMEYIAQPTVNQLSLTPENKAKISEAVNTYLKLSFHALLHDMPVVFHGDPHAGNVYIDSDGNIGFLDMGLIFEFQGEDSKFVQNLFMYSYMNRPEDLLEILLDRSKFQQVDHEALLYGIKRELRRLHSIPVSQFFIEMIGLFTQYDIAPPVLLFEMAKTFVALYGMGNVVGNDISTNELLAEQITEYYIRQAADGIQQALWGWGEIFGELVSQFWSGELILPTLEHMAKAQGYR